MTLSNWSGRSRPRTTMFVSLRLYTFPGQLPHSQTVFLPRRSPYNLYKSSHVLMHLSSFSCHLYFPLLAVLNEHHTRFASPLFLYVLPVPSRMLHEASPVAVDWVLWWQLIRLLQWQFMDSFLWSYLLYLIEPSMSRSRSLTSTSVHSSSLLLLTISHHCHHM